MATVAGRGVGGKRRRVVVAEAPPDWSRPGWLVPPSGIPPPVPGEPRVLWGVARGRQLEPECDEVVVQVARALLRVHPRRWQTYPTVLERIPVPGSAGRSLTGKKPTFATVMREWRPPSPWPPWRPLWPPATLVFLVAVVVEYDGASWAVAMLRWFCRRVIRTTAPSRRRRGRPALETFNRPADIIVAYERARRGRPDGSVSHKQVVARLARLGYDFSHLGPNTDPARQLKWNSTRRLRRQQAAAEGVPPHRSRGSVR
jgi:hypothetical protein